MFILFSISSGLEFRPRNQTQIYKKSQLKVYIYIYIYIYIHIYDKIGSTINNNVIPLHSVSWVIGLNLQMVITILLASKKQ